MLNRKKIIQAIEAIRQGYEQQQNNNHDSSASISFPITINGKFYSKEALRQHVSELAKKIAWSMQQSPAQSQHMFADTSTPVISSSGINNEGFESAFDKLEIGLEIVNESLIIANNRRGPRLGMPISNQAMRRMLLEKYAANGVLESLGTCRNYFFKTVNVISTLDKNITNVIHARGDCKSLNATEMLDVLTRTGIEVSVQEGVSKIIGEIATKLVSYIPISGGGFVYFGVKLVAHYVLNEIYHWAIEQLPDPNTYYVDIHAEQRAMRLRQQEAEKDSVTAHIHPIVGASIQSNLLDTIDNNSHTVDIVTPIANNQFPSAQVLFHRAMNETLAIESPLRNEITSLDHEAHPRLSLDIEAYNANIVKSLAYHYHPIYVPPQDESPTYKPGDRGSFYLSNETGKWVFNAKVSMVNAPHIALPLAVVALLVNPIKHYFAGEKQKQLNQFRYDWKNLLAAKENDWIPLDMASLHVSWQKCIRFFTRSSETVYEQDRQKVIRDIDKVIAANSGDANKVLLFRVLRYRVVSEDENVFVRNPFRSEADMNKALHDCLENFNSLKADFYQALEANDLVKANKTLKSIEERHDPQADIYLMQAELKGVQGEFPEALKLIEKGKEYVSVDTKIEKDVLKIEQYFSEDNINFAEQYLDPERRVFESKFQIYQKRAINAPADTKPSYMAELQNLAFNRMNSHPGDIYEQRRYVSTLVANQQYKEAIPYQIKICEADTNHVENIYFLANLQDMAGDITHAIANYKLFLAETKHLQDSAMRCQAKRYLRDIYIEQNNFPLALKKAEKIKNAGHGNANDFYLHGKLLLELQEINDGIGMLQESCRLLKISIESCNDPSSKAEMILAKNIVLCDLGYAYLNTPCGFYEAKEIFRKLSDEDKNNAKVAEGLKAAIRQEIFFYWQMSKLGISAASQYVLEKKWGGNIGKGVVLAYHSVDTLGHDLIDNAILGRGLLKELWGPEDFSKKARVFNAIIYSANKIAHSVGIAEQWHAFIKGKNFSDQICKIEWRKVQEFAYLSHGAWGITKTFFTVPSKLSGYQIFGSWTSYVNVGLGVVALAFPTYEFGADMVHRYQHGKPMPAIENYTYHSVKYHVTNTVAVASFYMTFPIIPAAELAICTGVSTCAVGAVALGVTFTTGIPIPPDAVIYLGTELGVRIFVAAHIIGINYASEKQAQQARLTSLFKNAVDLANQGQLDQAKEKFITYSKEESDQSKELFTIAVKYIQIISEHQLYQTVNESQKTNNINGIIDAYNLYLKAYPHDDEKQSILVTLHDVKLLQEAHQDIKDKHYGSGLRKWETYVERHPENSEQKEQFSQAKCFIYLEEKNEEKLLEECDQRFRKEPDDKIALKCRGMLALSKGEVSQAADDIARVIKIDPEDPQGYQNMASIYQYKGRFSLACSQLKTAIALFEERQKKTEDVHEKEGIDLQLQQAREQLKTIDQLASQRWHATMTQTGITILGSATQGLLNGMQSYLMMAMNKPSLPHWRQHKDYSTTANRKPPEEYLKPIRTPVLVTSLKNNQHTLWHRSAIPDVNKVQPINRMHSYVN